jgi:hypothetical protein
MFVSIMLALSGALAPCSLDSLPMSSAPTMVCVLESGDTLNLYRPSSSAPEAWKGSWVFDLLGSEYVMQGDAVVYEDNSARLSYRMAIARTEWDMVMDEEGSKP